MRIGMVIFDTTLVVNVQVVLANKMMHIGIV